MVDGHSGMARPVGGPGEAGPVEARARLGRSRVVSPRRRPARRAGPVPAGPGRGAARPARFDARPVPGRRPAPAARPPAWPVAGRTRPPSRRAAGGDRAPVAVLLALALGAALAVFGLGAVADAVRGARVPEATGPVVVRVEESLWQVARRAAPSGEPDAVVRRIVELNDLASPSVQAGRVLVSPIG